MAQLVARAVRDCEVVGSSPITQTILTRIGYSDYFLRRYRAQARTQIKAQIQPQQHFSLGQLHLTGIIILPMPFLNTFVLVQL